ncbi:response regulator transcription factor [Rubrimonas cliftonensis]|nr:helix-turn-helix transcriptional regulator [Rubrimonas cliftonensis]
METLVAERRDDRTAAVSEGAISAVGAQSLSPREREIASLTCRGLSNKEIGRRLDISHHTVSTHMRRIFDKLGVNRRACLARIAAEAGL